MEKGALLDRLGVTGDDRTLIAKVLDRAARSRDRNIPAATAFLSPREQALTAEALKLEKFPETAFRFDGGYEGAERRMALFLPDWQDPADAEPPLRALRAAYRAEDKLTHRDLLGSLMGLGVVREKIGDILAGDEGADVLVDEGVAEFLLQNWEAAGRAKLTVTEIDRAYLHIPAVKVQDFRDTVSSLRLDAIAASGFRMGRGKAAELIEAGRVQVNWRDCDKPDRLLAQGDTVTARGFGKLELLEVGGLTRKGRTSIVIRRYL